MTEERPEALLKSALEKIIYFEARSEALHGDLQAVRSEAERLKGELGQAAERELALRQKLAESEVQAARAHRERDAAARLNEALRQERASLIDKIVEAARIHGAGSEADEDGFDLASFIAQLRSEALGSAGASTGSARTGMSGPVHPERSEAESKGQSAEQMDPMAQRAGDGTGAPRQGSTVSEHAERLRAEGRLEVRAEELAALSHTGGAGAGRTEETLFGFSVRELSSPDPGARTRAAERLEALGAKASAPALATAIHHERDGAALVALLGAFGALAGSEGIAVVAPQLSSREPAVRTAALKALLALDPSAAAPYLSTAMKDEDASVRRRASLLALGLSPDAALGLGEQAARDPDPDVRALGALALGAATGERARALLLGALRDAELKVRQAAARGLSRLVGEDLSAVASLPDAQRRREIRRVATLPVSSVSLDEVRGELALRQAQRERENPVEWKEAPVERAEGMQLPVHPERRREAPESKPALSPVEGGQSAQHVDPVGRQAQRARVAVLAPALPELSRAVVAALRRSLRGLTLPDLAAAVGEPSPQVNAACAGLVRDGSVVRRGIKYFVA